eukprot:6214833-Pleurochrysis_carterae.AAC.5
MTLSTASASPMAEALSLRALVLSSVSTLRMSAVFAPAVQPPEKAAQVAPPICCVGYAGSFSAHSWKHGSVGLLSCNGVLSSVPSGVWYAVIYFGSPVTEWDAAHLFYAPVHRGARACA